MKESSEVQWKMKAVGIALSLVGLSACSFQHDKTGGGGSGVTSQDLKSFEALQTSIFQPKCVQCHSASRASGGVDLSTYQSIINTTGLIKPGSPADSLVYTEVESGSMPDGGPTLPAREVQAIGDWISAGAPNGSFSASDPPSTSPQPIPTAVPTPMPQLDATFTEVKDKILVQACVRCHSGANPPGHVDLTSFGSIVASPKKLALAGDPSNSLLFTEIESGSMPPRGPRLAPELVQLMKNWINAGAKND